MRISKVIALLLSLNLLVLAYLALRPQPAPAPASAQAAVTHRAQEPRAPRSRNIENITLVTNEFHWRQLESEDYRTYIERLRTVGCPEQTIRDIIIADLDHLFAPQLRSIYPYHEHLNYWEPEEIELINDVNQEEALRQERTVEREKRAVVKELIGVDLVNHRLELKGQEDYYDRRLGFLTEEKRSEVRDLVEYYHDQEWQIREKQWREGLELSPEEQLELRELQEAKEAQLSGLLSPQEKQLYDLWMSDTASQVRHDIYGMNATEQEFLAIYNLRSQFEKEWDTAELQDPTRLQQYQQAQQQLDDQIRLRLGDQRFAEYKRGQDQDFHNLSALATRFSLPSNVPAEIYNMKQDFLAFRDAVGFDARLGPDQKEAALQAVYEETLRSIKTALGQRAFAAYQKRATWLKP